MKFNIKKKFVSAISIGLASAMVLTACGTDSVAKVNGEEISKETYDKSVKMNIEGIKGTYGEDALKTEVSEGKTMEDMIRENTLDELTRTEAVLQDAEKRDIKVTDKEVEESMSKTKEQMGGEDKYKEMITAYGIDDAFARNLIKEMTILQKHKEAVLKETKVSEEDEKKYFDENKDSLVQVSASHILVATEEEAKEISDAIKSGAKFEDYVSKSTDTSSASNGGSVGYFPRTGAMVEEFSSAAFGMNVGDISEPVKTEYGYHIIRLDDKKDTFEKLKADIATTLKEQKYQEVVQKVISSAKIEKILKFEENKTAGKDTEKSSDSKEENTQK